MKKLIEEDGGDASSASGAMDNYATLANTPGMGDPKLPSGDHTGSGDLWPNLMDFMSWKRKKKRLKRKKRP